MAAGRVRLAHPFPPVWDSESRVLILGSFPSVKSRQEGFYYANPRNRFWPMLEAIYSTSLSDAEGKKAFLLEHHIALWDSIASCSIIGSADSTIEDAVANDIAMVTRGSKVERIITNGATSHRVYQRFIKPALGIEDICLPSTSPANAAFSLERLTGIWRAYLPATL